MQSLETRYSTILPTLDRLAPTNIPGVFKHMPGGAIKATEMDNGTVEGYLVSWGNPKDTDLQGEWFTKDTDFCLNWFPVRPALYHHGLDNTVGLKSIGMITTVKADDLGLWVQAQLDLRDKYARAVYEMVKAQQFGWSSGSVDHLVKTLDSGQIIRWPLIEGSITPTPAQPSKVTVRAMKALLKDEFSRISNLRGPLARVDSDTESGDFDKRIFGGTNIMASKSSRTHVIKAARSLGIKLEPGEVEAMADDLDEAVAQDDFDEAAMQDDFDPALMQDDFDDAVMQDDFDDAILQDDFDPAMLQDDFDAYAQDDFDPAMLQDDFDPAMLQDDFDPALMQDDFDDAVMSRKAKMQRMKAQKIKAQRQKMKAAQAAKMSRKNAAMGRPSRKSVDDFGQGTSDVESQARYWRQRAIKAEQMEIPGQRERGFLPNHNIIDEADQKGGYPHAFKAYIRMGEGRLPDREKYVLNAKGYVNFGPSTMTFDGGERAIKTYTGGSDASWGYAVPENWINELNRNVMTEAKMAADCRTVNTTSDRVVQPNLLTTDARRAHAANVSWPGEVPAGASDYAATEDQLSQIAIPIYVMMINHTSSLSALEDSAFDLESEINDAFAEATTVAYESLIWNGNGQGKLMGITNDPTVTSFASTSNTTVGGYLATGSASGFLNADVIKRMVMQLPQGYRGRAKWYMNSNTAAEIMTLKDGMGNYLIDPRDEALRTAGIPDRLMRYPIVYNEWATDIASGAFPVILGDLSRAYTIAKRVEFSVRRFDDAYYAVRDQVLFLGRARVGGQVTQQAALKALKIATS